MNLQALYDLKERLEHAAIAGTGLLHEDFRLRRAVEALEPLAKANPVFAKISAGTIALLKAPEDERCTKLLDVLSLVDAVVYTQGTTTISGTLTDLTPGSGSYTQVSHGQLQPLLTALSGTGSGRTSLIREYWSSHPEYFSDFRVLPHVIAALGDNYGELADLIGEILLKQGNWIIPLLKENFDPAGKTEMARRVRLIAWKAGETENDWFIRILPDSKKDVREAVIHALGMFPENTQLLMDLCQTERGKLKEASMRALAMMDDPRASAFWEMEVKKHPASITALSGVDTQLAANLTSAALRNYLEKLLNKATPYSATELDHLQKLLAAFCGKYSASVRDFWLWIGDRMESMHRLLPDELVIGCDCSLAEMMQRCLLLTILRNPCYGMLRLARELSIRFRRWFLCCGLMADLLDLDCSAEQTFEKYSPCIKRTGPFTRESEVQEWERIQIMRALAPLNYDPALKMFRIAFSSVDPLGLERECSRSLRWLDPRWAILLADHGIAQEAFVYDLRHFRSVRKIQTRVEFILMNLIMPEYEEVCQVCGEYLYKRLKITGQFAEYLDALLRCGWKDWKGLLAYCIQKDNQVVYHRMLSNLRDLPITNGEKAAELRQIQQLVHSGRVSVWNRIWPAEQIEYLIIRLESGENIDIL